MRAASHIRYQNAVLDTLLSMQSKLGPAGRSLAKHSLPIASQTSEPADDGPGKPSPVRQPFVGVRVFSVLLRELWDVLPSCTLQGGKPDGNRFAYKDSMPQRPSHISSLR